MESWQTFINKLDWNEYKDLWSKFWFQKLGYDPNSKGIAKVISRLPVEEARKRDAIVEEEFLNFVKCNYNK